MNPTKATATNLGTKKNDDVISIAIIGAGFSGLGMAIHLEQAGITDYAIVEAGPEVGGTWRDARYPGAAVDVPNHLYSFSFEQNPEWSRMFSKSEEIQEYILAVTEKYNLRPKISFNTKVVSAKWDESAGVWSIQTAQRSAPNGSEGNQSPQEKTIKAKIVISAIGPFAKESIPAIPGVDKFAGQMVHTARWKKDLNLAGKTVAVVGSGASAIQVAPAIAGQVKELKIFQRTPSWIIPKLDYTYSELERLLYRHVPVVQSIRRGIIFGLTELLGTAIVWDTPMTSLLESICRNHIEKNIKDPVLRAKVTPNYRLGSTRMLISNDWYPTLTKPNVELVAHGVDELTPDGIIAAGKKYPADVIVWATGYQSPSQGFPFPITGRDSVDLNRYWADGAKGYKGIAIEHFPNLFSLMGPNTGPGHTSVLVYTEAQMKYIVQAVQAMRKAGLKSIEVKAEKMREFDDFIDKRMKQTTWGHGGNSWYYTKSGRNTTLYPGFASEYVASVREFNLDDYKVETAAASQERAAG